MSGTGQGSNGSARRGPFGAIPIAPRPGAVLAGCTVERELGRGAMGVVYAARDPAGRAVAVKVMLQRADASNRLARFERELDLARSLDHPGIVRVLGGDIQGEFPCLVLEFVQGVELDEVFQTASLDRKLDLLEQVCRAVDYAHKAGVLHRDLKPANVLVTADGRAKVADFGLAREMDRQTRLTKTGASLGTPAFMAPEQVTGDKDTGPAVDVYALGVMLYVALTGELPFLAGTAIALMAEIISQEAPKPSTHSTESLGANHDRVVARALAKDPAKRHPSAEALADEIAALRAGRSLRPGRPDSRLFGALVLGAVGVVGGLVAVIATREPPPPAEPVAPPVAPQPVEAAPKAPVPTKPTGPRPYPDRYYEAVERLDWLLARYDTFVPKDYEDARGWAKKGQDAGTIMIETGPATLRNRLLSARCGDVALEPELAVQAIEQLEVAAGPDDGDLLYEGFLQGAICRLTQGKRAEAMAYLDKATELRPKRYEAYERRGRMLAEEAPRRAARILKRAYAMAPDAVRRSYATALWFAARDRDPDARRRAMIAQAEELLAQAIARDPDDGQSYSVRAWLRADAGRDAEAQADYKEALRAFNARKGFVGYLVMRARVSRTYYENSGSRLSSLRGSVARLLVASPWHALGATEAGIKEWIASKGTSPEGLQKAFDQLTRARQLNPLHWESALYLGRVLAAPWPGQDLKRAEAEARRAAELAPPN